MASNLGRLIQSLPRLARTGSEPPTRSAANSTSRLLSSSATQKPDPPERERAKQEAEREPEEREKKQRDDVDGDVDKGSGEIGGPSGPEPTRYGDWERNGRCYDF